MTVATFLNDLSRSILRIPAEVCAVRRAVAEGGGAYRAVGNLVPADGCLPCRAVGTEHAYRASTPNRLMSSLF